MKLIGNLKKKVSEAQTQEEAKLIIKDTIEEAGMLLDDEDLDKVSGGDAVTYSRSYYDTPM